MSNAAQIIILADHSLEPASADDRSIIVANAVHFLAKKDKISVQLINNENRQMLQRIGIKRIFIWDDLGAYLLADNIADANSLNIFTQLAKSPHTRFCTCSIDADFIGKTYQELFNEIHAQETGVLIGLITNEPELELDNIFDDNSSAIDQFIKSTLSKSKKLLSEDKNSIRINPPKDYQIQDIANTQKVLATLNEAHLPTFGENGILGQAPRTANVIAATDCDIYTLAKMEFDRFAEENTKAAYHIMKNIAEVLSQRLNITDENLVKLATALYIAVQN